MAIIPSIPGLEVSIQVRDRTAVEYDDPDAVERVMAPNVAASFDLPQGADNQPAPHIVKYIEAEPNAPFSFHVTKGPAFERRSHHIAYRLQIDGQSIHFSHEGYEGVALPVWTSSRCHQTRGNPTDGYKRHKFVFSAVNVVEGVGLSREALTHQTNLSERCGTLKVLFFHMDWRRIDDRQRTPPTDRPGPAPVELSEKALKGKAIDCSASFVAERDFRPPPKNVLRGYHDPARRPFAVFEFRYRFREGLMREGVIPRDIVIDAEEDEEDAAPVDGTRQRPIQIKEEHRRDPGRAKEEPAVAQARRGVKREAGDEAEGKPGQWNGYKERRLQNGRFQVDLTDD